jgi:hypothetical protein
VIRRSPEEAVRLLEESLGQLEQRLDEARQVMAEIKGDLDETHPDCPQRISDSIQHAALRVERYAGDLRSALFARRSDR